MGVRGERRGAPPFKAQRLGWVERGTYRWLAGSTILIFSLPLAEVGEETKDEL